jgi:glyoxalase family protein
MNHLITGLHHVTALASDPQKNLDFYAGILGLRLVKKTINFDAPEVYHLYYGNEKGSPGTILTFFPYQDIPKGRIGKGQLTVISFSIGEHSLDYWMKRFDRFRIHYTAPQQRFDEVFLAFEDFDGLSLELVANNKDSRPAFSYGNVPIEFAIKGFYGIALSEEGYEKTAGLLTSQLDHQLIAEKGNRFRYSASGKTGDFVDVLCCPDMLRGIGGTGTVHHVAFATANDKTQGEVRERLLKNGQNVTPVLDREYFHSIYFREPGGVLFEVATIPPGFSVDEDPKHLGETLKLPPWQEKNRGLIESVLPPIHLPKGLQTDEL